MKRLELCRASYWALFIIAPTALLTYYFKLGVGGVAVLVFLAVIGERLFRHWKKLWKLSE